MNPNQIARPHFFLLYVLFNGWLTNWFLKEKKICNSVLLKEKYGPGQVLRKRVLCQMRTPKVQIRAVWSAPLLFAA